LILGNRCTRNCKFCNVDHFSVSDKGQFAIDSEEPLKIAQAVKYYNLEYVVITSVTRDDLVDGGAEQFVETIKTIKKHNTDVEIEVLIPDFNGSKESLEIVLRQKLEIVAHNLETVERVYSQIRDRADYNRSLKVLKDIKTINPNQTTKSSIMLGLGESEDDLKQALVNLRSVNCDMLVLGQYLRPSLEQYPVKKFYTPDEFKVLNDFAFSLGFKSVSASPIARTSYLAKEQEKCMMS